MTSKVELDPTDPFEAALIKIATTRRSKSQDYSGDNHPNQNFYDVGYQLGQTGGHAVESLIGTKQARLRVLLPRHWKDAASPNNEPIPDTLLDRAVFSVISMTIWEEGGYLWEEEEA